MRYIADTACGGIACEAESDSRDKDAFFIVEPNQQQLAAIGNLPVAGSLRVFVDGEIPLDEAPAAYARKTARKLGYGKTVVVMGCEDTGNMNGSEHQTGDKSMGRLAGKCALITGGTSGIGLETARQFLREGARVMITGNTPKNLESALKELGADVVALISDAADVGAQKQLAAKAREHFGTLDVLFLNAGIVDLRPIEQMDEAAFDRCFAINLKGPYFLIQALLPVFGNPASIVLNASVNAHIGMPNTSVYAATKAALASLVRTLSGELIGRGIRVNAISPGPVSTPLLEKAGFSEAELKNVAASIQGMVPAKRFGTPSEIASAVVFFASDESAFTVGSELLIDGGMGNL